MPTLSQLQDTTTPITVKRGTIVFTLNAALEKLASDKSLLRPPTEGVTYADLLREEAGIVKDAALLRIELNRLADALMQAANPERIRARVAETRGVKTKAKIAEIDLATVSDEEVQGAFEHLAEGVESKIGEVEGKTTANDEARSLNYAKRLAYLVSSTDLEADSEGRALVNGVNKSPQDWQNNANLYFECFTPQLLRGCLEEVEGAVYSPLTTSGS